MIDVFVSYSRRDEGFYDELLPHLENLELEGLIRVRSDKMFPVGCNWEKAIQKEVANARVVVLIVTKHYLASKNIRKLEFNPIIERWRSKDLEVIWVAAGSCSWDQTALHRERINAALDPKRTIASFDTVEECDDAWRSVVKAIEKLIPVPQ